ncbi:hypothetical protein FNV43_RR07418 [Rhamnella rubrinervis]|uniref:Uncharacterized protein n=1 Tax=Rhamnella rubrinervis TaxID=2594499 RepID=A0A8K0HFU3_9ROSA|nr:hypothetical protein FNV43_RR07418 [Rhamnella rubrinervis]
MADPTRSDHLMVEYGGSYQIRRWIAVESSDGRSAIHRIQPSQWSNMVWIRPSNGRIWSNLPDLSIERSDREIQQSNLVGSTIFDYRTVGSGLITIIRSLEGWILPPD